MDLLNLTAVELGKEIKAGNTTAVEAMEAVIAQIEKTEDNLNCYVTFDKEKALENAKKADEAIKAGKLSGALAGVPVAIKDNMCTKGMLTTCSSKILENFVPTFSSEAVVKLEEAGAEIIEYDDAVRVTRFKPLTKCNVKTMPHPGFPTDMQPQIAVLLSLAKGTSILSESVWDNRFQYVGQLLRMGANIQVDGKIAVIEGVDSLSGVNVKATDLRAGAAMVIAGLVAKGETTVEDIQYIDRGYEDICEKLTSLGADIKRVVLNDDEAVVNAG